jgi:UDP-N-acetyl-D-glucosamine dehydrogenase
MPQWVVGKIAEALDSTGKRIDGSRILVLGIAYKKNVDDVRESPSVEIMQQLRGQGAEVGYCDPYFPQFPPMRRYDFDLRSEAFGPALLSQYDCVVIGTDHDVFDYDMIFNESGLVVDARGRAKTENKRVFKA